MYASACVGLAELALGGCTTSTDHLYLHPHGAGDLLSARDRGRADLGMRFHPTRGSMSLSEKDGGLPPDDVVADDDEILAACEEAVARHHDRAHGAMVRIALAPCSPFSVTEALMVRTAELAERLDVRLHTHFAENAEDDAFSLAQFGCRPMEYLERTGWCHDRTWVAHCVMPNEHEIARLGDAGVGVAHCPSSNMILVVGHRSGRAVACRRRERRARRRWLVVGRQRVAVDGSPAGDAAGEAARRCAVGHGTHVVGAGDGRRGGVPRSHGRDRRDPTGRCCRPGRVAARRPDLRRRVGRPRRGVAALRAGVGVAHDCRTVDSSSTRGGSCTTTSTACCAPTPRHAARIQRLVGLMPAALEAFLVAFGVVFLAELPDKTMFATIVLSTRYRRPVAVVVGVTLAMIFHSVLAVAVGEASASSAAPADATCCCGVCSSVGGIVLLRGSDDDEEEIETAPVHSVWGVIGRTALVIGIAEFGDFTQLATVGIVANRGYPAAVAAGSVAAHIVVAILAVLAGKWLERRLPVRTIQRLAGVLFIVFGVVTVTSAIRG